MRKSLATAAISLSLLTGIGIGTTALGSAGAQEATTTTADPNAEAAPRSPVQWIKDALKGLVDDGTIDQAQADKVAETLAEARPPRGPGGPGEVGRHHRHGPGFHLELSAAANALGMTNEELRTALSEGKSLAQLADEKDVDLQKVKDALIAAATAKIDGAVAAGRLTEAEAAEKKANLPEMAEMAVNMPGRPFHKGHGPGHRHGPPPVGAPAPEAPAAEGTSL